MDLRERGGAEKREEDGDHNTSDAGRGRIFVLWLLKKKKKSRS